MKNLLKSQKIKKYMFLIMFMFCICFCRTTFYADEISSQENETSYKIYTMNDWAKEFISIPDSYLTSFQIPTSDSSNISYKVISGESVEVSDTGLVIPKIETWYYIDYGNYFVGTTTPDPNVEYDKITNKAIYGSSTIQITDNGKTSEIIVEVCDYATTYADEVIDNYVEENFTDTMTVEEKLEMICKLPASYSYSADYSGYTGMIVSGGGDCWASTSLILEVCDRVGVEAKVRNGNRDPLAGSGHVNVLVTIGEGEYYELEAGYVGTAPRYYSIEHRTSLFCYRDVTDGIEVYQYDGDLTDTSTLIVPEIIDSKTVVSLGENFVSMEDVKEVILPNTITTIKKSAFNSCSNLQTLHIPASVTSIGEFVFTNCKSLTNLTCDEENVTYTVKDGILYSKDYTTLFYAPVGKNMEFPAEMQTIGTYAFYYSTDFTEIILLENLKTLEEGAFAKCFDLEKITLKAVEKVGAYAFADNVTLESVFFEGDAPTFEETAFYNTTTTVYYPMNNDTWTEDIMQNYSGTITWIPYDPTITMGDIDGDKEVTIEDMLTILHSISGSQTLNESQKLAADIDKDGAVTISDMLSVMHYISGAKSTL